MVEMREDWERALDEMRAAGWAVRAVSPEELDGVAPSWVEVEMGKAAEREVNGDY